MWRSLKVKNPKATGGKNVVYYVYDVSTTMSEFCASFAVRKHAEEWGKLMFGENSYVSDRRLHHNDWVWNGRTEKR